MDELAHSNAPGSRHPNAGRILKSYWKRALMFLLPQRSASGKPERCGQWRNRNSVRETVPDPFFDAADDVVLVDCPRTICAND